MKRFILGITLALAVSLASAQPANITITITIPGVAAVDIVESLCATNQYRDMIPDPDFVQPDPFNRVEPTQIPNPESKQAFAKRMLREYIADAYKNYQVEKAGGEAASLAKQAKRAEVEANADLITVQ